MQNNSFVSFLERIALLNKNAVEVLTKLNDIVASQKSDVSINYMEDDGSVSKYQMPTVGYLQKELDIANTNIKRLAGIDDSTIIMDKNSSRKIKSINLNREPNQINNISNVKTFEQTNNWFFDSLINPTLSITLNLSDQIDDKVKKVISRRYIVQFEKDENNLITTNGQKSLTEFTERFLNKNDFSIVDFESWLLKPTNIGVLNNDQNMYMDEQTFDVNWKEVMYKGYFSVLKTEKDTLNNKLWYHFNTLNYYGRDNSTKTLVIGDIVVLTNQDSFTKYQVLEINKAGSLNRVSLERIEGFEPVAPGTNMLEYYSPLSSNNTVKISIGYDEYIVLFVKPVNTENYIKGSTWSKGSAFYTNDLVLSTDAGVTMPDFYQSSVYDYGLLLKDLIVKKIPTVLGLTPDAPAISSDNFKVVQINKHLTDTKDSITLKKLHSQKNSIKSKISQLNDSVIQKNKELNTKVYKSVAEKSKSQNELEKTITMVESQTKLYNSIVSQIMNARADTGNGSRPKFRVRGFWTIPDPQFKTGQKPQEVIGFETQYRYSSKLGNENATEGYNVPTTDTSAPTTGYFSEWVSIKSDIRKRVQNAAGEWYWQIEDVSDADTPNINQLDIPIQRNEKVEIKIRSISEVGYPDSLLMSDWSESIIIEFPDDLNDVLGENDFILKEATQEEMRAQFENELTSKGVIKHVSGSYYSNDKYFAHDDTNIATSFKDNFGNTLSLFEYLKTLNDKISALEESIKRAKGELKITLFNGTDETVITNNAVIYLSINCEDFMERSGSTASSNRDFLNNVYCIEDYYLLFENIATENPLSLLTDKTEISIINSEGGSIATEYSPTFIDQNGTLRKQSNNQFIWLTNKDNSLTNPNLYSGTTTSQVPYILCLDDKNLSGSYDTDNLLTTNHWYNSNMTLTSPCFGATVHPKIQIDNAVSNLVDINSENLHIIDAQDTFKLPLNIYFKQDLKDSNGSKITLNTSDPIKYRKKTIKFFLENEFDSRPFRFTLHFNLISHRGYSVQPSLIGGISRPTVSR